MFNILAVQILQVGPEAICYFFMFSHDIAHCLQMYQLYTFMERELHLCGKVTKRLRAESLVSPVGKTIHTDLQPYFSANAY